MEIPLSWDVAIVRISGSFRPLAEVGPEDYLPLGGWERVRAAVSSAFPSAEWFTRTRALYVGPGSEIEVCIDSAEPLRWIRLCVHFSGGDPTPMVLELAEANGWLAADYAAGQFLESKSEKGVSAG